jgi:hypothetical protein
MVFLAGEPASAGDRAPLLFDASLPASVHGGSPWKAATDHVG